MHPPNHRPRRQHDHNGDDDEVFIGSRAGSSSDSYNRSRPYVQGHDSYRASSTSARSSYTREPPPSRHYDDWPPGDPPYAPVDPYDFRGSDYPPPRTRDEYDMTDPREPDTWGRRYEDPNYKGAWDRRSTAVYPETSWGAYDARGSAHDVWPSDPNRGGPSTDRDHIRENVDDHRDVEAAGWRNAPRKDGRKELGGKDDRRGGDPSTWHSDAGWKSRRSDGRLADTESVGGGSVASYSRPVADDRSWEPAPTWQAQSHGDTHAQGSHKSSRNAPSGKNSKGKKRNQSSNNHGLASTVSKQAKDWRNDDSALNNWSKRDPKESPSRSGRAPQKRREWSRSRSRSRSPADSYYSRRSSRGRSRSRSASPKRRRRDDSTARLRSRSPTNRGRNRAGIIKGREYSKSPTSSVRSKDSRGARRRSLSSDSISSRSSGSSRSPADQPKAKPKHRLPAATHVTITKAGAPRASGMLPPADTQSHRSGKQIVPAQRTKTPRRGPPSKSNQRASYVRSPSPSSSAQNQSSDLHTDAHAQNGQSLGASKNAGFKPIGQASSAVKMFFPADDDDAEQRPVLAQSGSAVISQAPMADHRFHPQTDSAGHLGPSSNSVSSRQTADGLANDVTQETTPNDQREPVPVPQRFAEPEAPVVPPHSNGLTSMEVTALPTGHTHTVEYTRPNSPHSEGTRGELYAIISQVGEGTFGKVYKARNTVTRVYVALKRIRMESERDGFPVTAMREIKLLQSLRHPNIVRLYEMMVSNGSVYMVFEYMDHDLTGVLSQTQFQFADAHLKSLCQQMLAGLAYLHHKGVIHRDIKGSNILLNNKGELKLGDFGLARFYQKRRRSDYTNRVITLWYRPPELLFGATVYGPEVDMWSAGCIMLELFTKKPVFQGNDEIHQLDVIYRIFGTPAPERWSGVADLPWYELIKPREAIPDRFRELFNKWLSPAALDLAERLLAYDPTQRVTALEALEAPYFKQELPDAILPTGLSTLEGEWHELETKRERAKKRKKTEP